LYHFGGDVCAQLEEQYPEGVAVRHTDGRITSPIAAGGFDTSEDTLPREDFFVRYVRFQHISGKQF
jgi:hypothetical protein